MSNLGTILWLRRRMAIRELSSLAGALNLAAGIALMIVAALGSLAIAAALGFLMGMAVVSENPDAVSLAWSVTLYTVSFFALGVPILVGAGETSFDPSRLLRFPLSRRRLFHLSLASEFFSKIHLAWYPTIIVATFAGVLIPGPTRVGPVVLLVLFAATMVVWSNTLLLLVRRILRQRRLREIAAVLGLALVLVVAFLPISIDLDLDGADERLDELLTIPGWIRSASAVLPPSITARSLTDWRADRTPSALIGAFWLAVWLAGGWIAGASAFENLLRAGWSTSGRSAPRTVKRPGVLSAVFDRAPPAMGAVATKELRYLLQSGTGRMSLIVMPLVTAVPAIAAVRHAETVIFGFTVETAAFLGIMVYAAALMGNLQVNAFAWEKTGFATYFTSPVRLREIIIGKNLGLWVFNLAIVIEGLLVWGVLNGLPQPAVAATGVAVFASTVVLTSMIGNFTSVAFPIARPIATVTSASSPIGTLVMVGCMLVGLIVSGVATLGAGLAGSPGLQPAVALVFLGLVLAVYSWSLGPASVALGEHREDVARALSSP